MHTFKNITADGPKGVNHAGGTAYINPGETSRGLEVSEGDLKATEATGYFEIAEGEGEPGATAKRPEDGSLEHDTSRLEGNAVGGAEPSSANALANAALQGGQEPDFEGMNDEELRAFITDRDGRAPHPNTGREKLLTKARDASADDGGEAV